MDLRIMQVCKFRRQECVVVRSKADEHIRNCRRNNKHPTVESARNDYINQVRVETAGRNAEMNRIKELRLDFKDYIISEMGLSQLVNGAPPSRDPCEHVIDEAELLQRLGL